MSRSGMLQKQHIKQTNHLPSVSAAHVYIGTPRSLGSLPKGKLWATVNRPTATNNTAAGSVPRTPWYESPRMQTRRLVQYHAPRGTSHPVTVVPYRGLRGMMESVDARPVRITHPVIRHTPSHRCCTQVPYHGRSTFGHRGTTPSVRPATHHALRGK